MTTYTFEGFSFNDGGNLQLARLEFVVPDNFFYLVYGLDPFDPAPYKVDIDLSDGSNRIDSAVDVRINGSSIADFLAEDSENGEDTTETLFFEIDSGAYAGAVFFDIVTHSPDGESSIDRLFQVGGPLVDVSSIAAASAVLNAVNPETDLMLPDGAFGPGALIDLRTLSGVAATTENDQIDGTSGDDTIASGIGNDSVLGGAGNDSLDGGDGADQLVGQGGMDTLIGGYGRDTLLGGADDDRLEGLFGNDSLYGGAGNDTAIGAAGNDRLFGEDGNDRLYGNAGFDRLDGGAGADTLSGGADGDILSGNAGWDKLFGDLGNDTLSGGAGGDKLWGGDGDDVLKGESGNDTLTGDTGADRFVFGQGGNDDLIADFETGIDRLVFDDALWGGGIGKTALLAQFASDTAEGVRFAFDDGSAVLVAGIADKDLLWGDIDFA